MSCGLPAVVTKNGGPSESMRQGEHQFGVLVDPADPQKMARGLLRVVGSPETWEHLQRAGKERVLSRYTWERTAQGYLRVIEGILRGPASPGERPVPEYFADPSSETDIPQSALNELYFA